MALRGHGELGADAFADKGVTRRQTLASALFGPREQLGGALGLAGFHLKDGPLAQQRRRRALVQGQGRLVLGAGRVELAG